MKLRTAADIQCQLIMPVFQNHFLDRPSPRRQGRTACPIIFGFPLQDVSLHFLKVHHNHGIPIHYCLEFFHGLLLQCPVMFISIHASPVIDLDYPITRRDIIIVRNQPLIGKHHGEIALKRTNDGNRLPRLHIILFVPGRTSVRQFVAFLYT